MNCAQNVTKNLPLTSKVCSTKRVGANLRRTLPNVQHAQRNSNQ